mgnify:CR=1 FL=1
MQNGNMTGCNQNAMLGYYLIILGIVGSLQGAYERATTLAADFEECYDGDAKAEVLMFLESLPLHIYRLTLLYSKLGDFVTITAQSLFNSDIGMVNNMEG